jgi:catechol 2,3-dioxygenase-like lactoylglutathione lyase family enzyme
MRLDHIAYRVADRDKTVKFFVDAFGYRIADEFKIEFEDGTSAKCYALSPPEAIDSLPLSKMVWWPHPGGTIIEEVAHIAPEIFVSEGSPDSIVDLWVADSRYGDGGIHHLAYEVDDVAETMNEWRENGWAQFTTEEPICNDGDLVQCFTQPHPLTGTIYEFIKRGEKNKGFNVDSVRDLMESTNGA